MKKLTRKKLDEFVEKHSFDGKVLNIGMGNRSYSIFYPNMITLDVDKNKNPDVVGDAHNLPFDDNSFDFILCTEVLEHLEDPQKAVDEMYRVLAPGGTLVLTTRFIFPVHTYQHDYFRFTEFGLRKLFKRWRIEEFEDEAGSFETMAILAQRLIFQVKFKYNKIVKIFLYFITKIFLYAQRLIITEYADIRHEKEYANFICSGYYLVCKK